ncbi:hypothetical protein ACN47E_003660 [Coniothyrium glycines]
MKDWYQSYVIYSLLHRPVLFYEWTRLLESKDGRITNYAWNSHSTGRVEGYPESNPIPNLQDQLEYFSPAQDAAALARLAYAKAVKRAPQLERCAPPPVPLKDDYNLLLAELTTETENWTEITNSLLHDASLPSDVCELKSTLFE